MQVPKTRSGLFVIGSLAFLLGMIFLTLNAEPALEMLLGKDRVQRFRLQSTNNKAGVLDIPDTIATPQRDAAMPVQEDILLWLEAKNAIVDGKKDFAAVVPDQSGNGNHAITTTDDEAPKLIRGAMNGHDVLRFNGKKNHYHYDSLSYGHPTCVVAVYQKVDSGGMSYQRIVSSGAEGMDYQSGGVSMFPDSEAFGVGAVGPTVTIKNGKNLNDYRNFFIGFPNVARTRQIFEGDLAELIVFKRSLSKPERNAIEQYLQQKYGIQPTS